MSQPPDVPGPDVPGPDGPGPTPPDPDGAATPGWAQPSPGTPPDPPAGATPLGPYGTQPVGPYGTTPVGPYGVHAGGPGDPAPGAPPPYGPPSGYEAPPGYAPGVKPKRFSGGYVVLGMLACWAVMLLPTSIALGFVNAIGGSGGGTATLGIGGLSLVAPLVVGAVLVGRGSPQRRGFGLGMFVGWGLFVVVGAGACIALLAALSSTGG